MTHSELDHKRYRLECYKLWLASVAVAFGIIGPITAYMSYLDEKKVNRETLYNSHISMLGSENVSANKTALKELINFPDKYADLAPVIVDFMIRQKLMSNSSLDTDIIVALKTIGNPGLNELSKVNRSSQQIPNEKILKISQWAIGKVIRNEYGGRVGVADLKGIELKNISLSNVRLANFNLSTSRFENVIFDGSELINVDLSGIECTQCSFWGARFLKNTILNQATFNNCNFQDSYVDSDLRYTDFNKTNFLNVEITQKKYIDEKTLSTVINPETVNIHD